MWVARDEDGKLFFYANKPVKANSVWDAWDCGIGFVVIDANLFPEVKWDDDEPTEIEIIIKRKENDYVDSKRQERAAQTVFAQAEKTEV